MYARIINQSYRGIIALSHTVIFIFQKTLQLLWLAFIKRKVTSKIKFL